MGGLRPTQPDTITQPRSEELSRRPARAPNHDTESRALADLADALATQPERFLQRLADAALQLCGSGSAGVSLRERNHEGEVVRASAVAGRLASRAGDLVPASASPCAAIDESEVVLLTDPDCRLVSPAPDLPPITEALLAPIHVAGEPMGAVWVASHEPGQRFDAEDGRLLRSLSRFASAGYRLMAAIGAATAARADLEQRVRERTAELQRSNARLSAEVEERSRTADALRLSEQRHRALADALRQSEERLRMAVSAARVGVWDVDVDSGAMHVSANMIDVVGFDMGADLATSFELLHPSDRERVQHQYQLAMHGQDFFDSEYRCLHPDTGEVVWLRTKGHRTDVGDGPRFMGVTQNVTTRKRRETNAAFLAELVDALAQLVGPGDIMQVGARKVLEFLRLSRVALVQIDEPADSARLLYSLDRSGTVAEGGTYRLSGFVSPAYLKALRRGELVAVDDVATDPRSLPRAHALLPHGVHADIEAPYISEGRWRFHLSVQQGRPRRWREDEIELVRELAGQLWLRLERAHAMARLRQSREHMDLASVAAHVFSWQMCPLSGRSEFTGDVVRVLGYQPPAALEAFVLQVHPADRDRVVYSYQAALAGTAPLHVQYRLLRPHDGVTLWMRDEGVLVRESRGRPRALIGVSANITRRKEAEEALQVADRRKDEFIATLAHELRNPLAPLRNGLEVLQRSGHDEPVAQEARRIMARQLGHMSALVDDLLELSRISRGIITLRRQPLRLAEVVVDAVEGCRPLIDEAGHALTVTLEESEADPIVVDGDPLRLAQVLSNLLINATRYTDPGGRIDLHARRDGTCAVLEVRDNGIGIPAEMLPRVFDVFAQAHRDDARSQQGLGIGLSLVRTLVDMHGGLVEASSEGPGRGATFTVRLPLANEPAQPVPQPPEGPQPRTGALLRTLVVDDNHDAANSLRDMLRLLGAEVEACYDGGSALEAMERFRPEAVLLDIGMPGMDGCELARRIRADPRHAGVLLVALTGWGMSEDRRRTAEAGFDLHLLKPVDLHALEACLQRDGGR